jgi:hypothetical protein
MKTSNRAGFSKLTTAVIASTIVAILGAHSAQGAVAFNNFNPTQNGGYGYDNNTYTEIAGSQNPYSNNGNVDEEYAQQFQAGATGQLSDVILALEEEAPFAGAGAIELQLFNDSGGDVSGVPSGPALYTWANTGTSGTIPNGFFPPVVLTATNGPTLTSGNLYWLVASSVGTDQLAGWMENDNTPTDAPYLPGRLGISNNGGAVWSYYNNFGVEALEVDVQPVPEPSCLGLLGLGAVPILRRRRK